MREDNPIASRHASFQEATAHFFVKDKEHPYVQTRPYDWIRGYQLGGRSLTWGRWTQRWSEQDFEANAREGIAVDWPIRYRDLAPWYSHVERFVGVSGKRDGLSQVPDGEFLPPLQMTPAEEHFKRQLARHYGDRHLIVARMANLSVPHLGRGSCQNRNLCVRGCPFGGYFSSNSATLPAAARTGLLTIRPHSVVESIIHDPASGKTRGVRVIDANTRASTEYFAKLVFVNASTLNTTLILLNSTSSRFPRGMGNDSGELGHNLMDHNCNATIGAEIPMFQDQYYQGRRPGGVYLPRFRNLGSDRSSAFLRGFAYQGSSTRTPRATPPGLGPELKEALRDPGPWQISMRGIGECLPCHSNKLSLSPSLRDAWGMPLLEVDAAFGDNEHAMTRDMLAAGSEMFERAGFTNITAHEAHDNMGLRNHEMGTAHMGRAAARRPGRDHRAGNARPGRRARGGDRPVHARHGQYLLAAGRGTRLRARARCAGGSLHQGAWQGLRCAERGAEAGFPDPLEPRAGWGEHGRHAQAPDRARLPDVGNRGHPGPALRSGAGHVSPDPV